MEHPSRAIGDERAGYSAAQGDSLSRVAAMGSLGEAAFLERILHEASASLRAGDAFSAALIRRELDGWIVEATYPSAGSAFPAPGSSHSFDPALAAAALQHGTVTAVGAAWVVAAAVRTGAHARAIILSSPAEPRANFDARDRAYLDTLASMCGSRLAQGEQLARLEFASDHDALTGLPNRTSFRAQGFAALRAGTPASVVVLDLDRFHEVNDALGAQTGDALIVEVAAALQERAGDAVVARLCGDAFGILMLGADAAAAETRVARLFARFAEPFGTGDRTGAERIRLTTSAGIATASAECSGFEELLARADGAMHAAKRAGRARWSQFDGAVGERFAAARMLQYELARGVDADEFVLFFQPQFHLASGTIVGAEALIRWNHPERGLIAPGDFIPLAERYGVIPSISDWVVRRAVAAAARFRAFDPAFRVWFNLSSVELCDPGLLATVADLAPLHGLGVEITEDAVMQDLQGTLAAVSALKRAGLSVALDDFGTGRTALAQLKRLPLDAVKLDCSFTAGLPGDAQDRYIVETVVGMGRQFGFDVVAEGVETEAQARWLRERGCRFAQGFHLGRPMPETELVGLLDARGALLSQTA